MPLQNRQSMAEKAVGTVVGLTVAGLVAAFLIPIAVSEVLAVDTSAWSSEAVELWGILDVAIVLSVFLMMVSFAVNNGEG